MAQDFATTLKDDESEITKLVNYLNKFTRDVVQRCADISSESTKNVFVELRKDLKNRERILLYLSKISLDLLVWILS